MTAPRITAERIAELKRHYPRGAYSPNRKHHPFGHIAYSTIDIHELIDALESSYTELDRLRSAPVAVEVPEPTVQQWLHEVLDPAEADPDPHATMRHATRWFREHIRTIPSDRVLNDGEVAIRADVLSAMEGCVSTLRADDELIPSKALAHLDALRSKGGE